MSLFFRSFATLCSIIIFTASSQTSAVPFVWEDVEGSPLQIGRPVGASAGTPAVIRWEGFTEKGEPIHFALEPLSIASCQEGWKNYNDSVSLFTTDSVGILNETFYNERMKNSQQKLVDRCFGTTQCHLQAYKDASLAHKDAKANKKYKAVIRGVASGSTGMHTDETAYIAYASSQPITGYCHTSTITIKDLKYDLDRFIEDYGHIVMSVSLYPEGDSEDIYCHRGIFKNPWWVLKGGYSGIALMLHSFGSTAYCAQHPSCAIMYVRPDGNIVMQHILYNEFEPKEMSIPPLDEFDIEAYPNFVKKFEGKLPTDGAIKIKVSALQGRFCGFAAKSQRRRAEIATRVADQMFVRIFSAA